MVWLWLGLCPYVTPTDLFPALKYLYLQPIFPGFRASEISALVPSHPAASGARGFTLAMMSYQSPVFQRFNQSPVIPSHRLPNPILVPITNHGRTHRKTYRIHRWLRKSRPPRDSLPPLQRSLRPQSRPHPAPSPLSIHPQDRPHGCWSSLQCLYFQLSHQ